MRRTSLVLLAVAGLIGGCGGEVTSGGGSGGTGAGGDGGNGGGAGTDGGSGGNGGGSGGGTGGMGGAAGMGGAPADGGGMEAPPAGELVPPAGETSKGSGGIAYTGNEPDENANLITTPGGIKFRLVVPHPGPKIPCLIIYSGVEGSQPMSVNVGSFGPATGLDQYVVGVLHGVTYNGNAAAGADVLDYLRSKYDVDNDRTYLMGESAGTTAALKLGFDLRQSYFAAYWANDVNASSKPKKTATDLHFAPWGNAGPGGDFPDAKAIVGAMKAAGYRTTDPAPYDGPGSGSHGDLTQLKAAFSWFKGKSRL